VCLCAYYDVVRAQNTGNSNGIAFKPLNCPTEFNNVILFHEAIITNGHSSELVDTILHRNKYQLRLQLDTKIGG